MGIDQKELQRRRSVDKPKRLRHPYAAIDHRVIDSEAFQSLTGNAVKLLLLMLRQLHAGGNNGRLKTSATAVPRSVMAEHTISRATNELIAHGLIYRSCGREYDTKSGRGMAALYAVTWLPLTKQTEGLHLAGFVLDAWKRWEGEIKNPPAKMQCYYGKNGIYAAESTAEPAVVHPPKIARQKLLVPVVHDDWVHACREYVGRYGLAAGPKSIELSPARTLQ